MPPPKRATDTMMRDELISYMGWNPDSLVLLYREFIEGKNLDQELLTYLRERAREEETG